MNSLSQAIKAELNVDDVFTIPLFGGIAIPESLVVTWGVMAVLVVLALWLTHDMKVDHISKRQAFAEFLVTKLETLIGNVVGEKGKCYVPYLLTVLLYLALSNIVGIFGFKSPTKDLGVTASLALMSIVLVEAAGIRARTVKGWLKSFTKPVAIVTPINILEVFTRPLSLCMRLFGNVLGSFVIMELIKMVVPYVLPAVLSLYFDLFDGILQAYVFVFLTGLYIQDAIE
ncbi:MAG: F0F1 ATP synthase subunit A [Lachnospiraceae bacterium]|nr:F0F1 ATP synthase subunit A [Lachnospiraceae bacterium]MCH4070911.1 F0F1 ATP synthase subunit A [Lachnospiraceae bacterium]MCH4107900.1 F0F1 ATP synthase subunit A [Lachnospiraceae bacterium]MCI1332276.1 F0F1 ATP synthase subunit A [Lachnospiraceae bacterium]MCI1361606.1 F0F1 ATP synthase subunit A [Lachnospiraceae bacterium]